MSRVRNWCFTSFELLNWEALIGEKCTYIIVGVEVCPKTKKTHYQGYAEFSDKMVMSGIKKLFGSQTIHLEGRRGSQEQAIAYCKKDGDFEEFGELKKQGARTDMEHVRNMIKDGFSNSEIAERASSWQSINFTQKLREMLITERASDVKPLVYWIWGETGTGKTKRARELSNDDYDDLDYKNDFLIGYTGKSCVVFDDFRGGVPFNLLLKMLDYGKCTVNTKGGCVSFAATTVIITAPYPPERIYKKVGENLAQLMRRIDHLEELENAQPRSRRGNTNSPDSMNLD